MSLNLCSNNDFNFNLGLVPLDPAPVKVDPDAPRYSPNGAGHKIYNVLAQALKARFSIPGPIRASDAYDICRNSTTYTVVCQVFRNIIDEMIRRGQAFKIGHGRYWIGQNPPKDPPTHSTRVVRPRPLAPIFDEPEDQNPVVRYNGIPVGRSIFAPKKPGEGIKRVIPWFSQVYNQYMNL